MDVAAAKTALKRFGFDDTDPLLTWLNEGLHQFEMAANWPFLQKRSAAIAVAVGVNAIAVPSDFGKVISLRDQTKDNKLSPKTWQWFDREISDPDESGAPEYYFLLDVGTLTVWRVPDVATSFSLVYQEALADLVDPGSIPIPERHHYAIVLGAAYVGLMAENEENRAETAQSEFEAAIVRGIEYYGDENLDEFMTVQDTQGYGGGYAG